MRNSAASRQRIFAACDKKTPLRFSINGTYSLDNTGDVVADTEAARGATVTRIERYGLNFNRVDHFDISLGVEGFFVEERLRPFIEYNIMVPVNRPSNYLCSQPADTRAATTASRTTRSSRRR